MKPIHIPGLKEIMSHEKGCRARTQNSPMRITSAILFAIFASLLMTVPSWHVAFVRPATQGENPILTFITPYYDPSYIPGKRTYLGLQVPDSVVEDTYYDMYAILLDEALSPLSGQSIRFYRVTTFSALAIGEGRTDSSGKARATDKIREPGTYEVMALFMGDLDLAPSNDTALVTVRPATVSGASGTDGGFRFLPSGFENVAIQIMIVAVVGSVWGTFGFVLYQMYNIRKGATRGEKRSTFLKSGGGIK